MSEENRGLSKIVDDLAVGIINAEPDDLQVLVQTQKLFLEITNADDLSDAAKSLAKECSDRAEKIVLREYDDPEAEIGRLSQAVEALQQLVSLIDRGEPTDSAKMPDWFTGKSAAEQPTEEGQAEKEDSPEFDELPDDADIELLGEFLTESLDHIQISEAALLELETEQDPEKVNAIFRAFHTIKGTSGFLGFTCINKLAHKAETLLDDARNGKIELAGIYADLSFDSCDMLKKLLEYIKACMEGGDCEKPSGLNDLLERLESPGAETPEVPRVGDLLVAEGKVDRQVVEEAAAEKTMEPLGTRLIRKDEVKPKDVGQALRTQKAIKKTGGASEASVRVSTGRLDSLINMVGELVIAQSMVAQDYVVSSSDSQALARNVAQLDKITRDLQELGLSMRMVPLKNTFQKMARLIRDLSRKSGKKVKFVTEGEETEIDRNMVESINDPLVHMMRNAVDHGIEDPDKRSETGKPAEGTVTLRAYHAAGNVVIEIIDDGKGLDRDVILKKAVERGLVEPGRERDMPDSDVFSLVLQPGFSTAEKVTDVSGRGVGMDVVKRNIESIRGKLEISSRKGRGSVFSMRLPLTLAIIDGMLLHVGGECYILPTVTIREAIRPQRDAISTVKQKGEMVMVRGELIPIIRLNRLFGVGNANDNLDDCLLVIVEVNGKQCALLIDEIIGQQQVVIKSLGKSMGDIKGISGGAILGDGRVGLILDAPGLMTISQEATL